MPKWILFIHQISQDTPNLRVKVWRDLKKHGAVLFKNAIYILPYSKEHEETMQWLCKYIRDSGSDSSLFLTESFDRTQDKEIIKAFHESCDREYSVLISTSENFLRKIEQTEKTEGLTDTLKNEFDKKLREIKKDAEDILRIDFFNAPQKKMVSQKIAFIQKKLDTISEKAEKKLTAIQEIHKKKDYTGKTWATRRDIYIDRIASAWLIKRFIDTKARFVFLSKDEKTKQSLPFDMYGAEFTHVGDNCTFETLLKAFDLKDAALFSIGEIVHDIDLKDNKYGRREVIGIEQIIAGLKNKFRDDSKLLEKGIAIFDALYQYYRNTSL
ncbi:MAG: chromate resistance protein [Candidatus Brocadiaceae bacterium]